MDKSVSPYWSWLQQSPPIDEDLRWCHTTDAYALRSMMQAGCISTRLCPVFDESLTYFFYGRPAYRLRELEQIRLSAKAPVVLIFDASIENDGARVFPFDSGAFDGRYAQWKHSDMKVSSFQLPCGENAPKRHVSTFFGSRQRYLQMQAAKPKRDYKGEFEVEAVAEILCDTSIQSADDRRLAVELQLTKDLPLEAPLVSALILPERLLEAEWFKDWKEKRGADVLVRTYELSPLRRSAHYQSSIEGIAAELV